MSHSSYRADIDGLRAIAVLAVIIYHAFPASFRGGFTGVDVFFVISGFLITGIILKGLDNGKFSFIEFYKRRIRRIFPALLLVLSAVLVFGAFALFADEYKSLSKHVAGGAGFIANILYWQEVGYWDVSATVKPLLHLWSLGIEEQFYIFFPCILFLAYKKHLRLLTVILLFLAVSFFCNIHYYKKNPSLDFYLLHTRAWELLAGAVLAAINQGKLQFLDVVKEKLNQFSFNIFFDTTAPESKQTLSNITAFIGISLLIIGFATAKVDYHFPGYRALLPVLGAIFLIAAGQKAWVNRVILSNKLVVGIGLISYPLYLWHWPLISYAHILNGETAGVWEWRLIRLTCVALSFVLSILTYKLVEKPLRFGRFKHKKIEPFLILLMLCIGGAGATFYVKTPIFNKMAAYNAKMLEQPYFISEEGVNYALKKAPDVPLSFYYYLKANTLPDANSTIALIGDSHSWSTYPAIAKRNATYKINTLNLASWRTTFLGLETLENKTEEEKRKIREYANTWLEILASDPEVKQVYIFSRYSHYRNVPNYQQTLQETINHLNKYTKKAFIVSDVPFLKYDIRQYIKRPIQLYVQKSAPHLTKEEAKHQQDEFLEIINSLNDVVVVNGAIDAFCKTGECGVFSENGEPLYFDREHLTPFGSEILLNEVLEPYLQRITKE